MRRLIAILMVALFSAASVAAYAADQSTQPAPQKHAKKKKKAKSAKSNGVQQSANPMDKSGQGASQSSGTGGVQAGAPAAQGRGTPSGAAAAGGGGSRKQPVTTREGRTATRGQ